MSDPRSDPESLVPYDAGEDFDAGDLGDVVVPDGTAAILFAQSLVELEDAGFGADCG